MISVHFTPRTPCSHTHTMFFASNFITQVFGYVAILIQIDILNSVLPASTTMLYFSNHQPYKYAGVHFVPTAKVGEIRWHLLLFCDMMVWYIIYLIHKSHILLGLAFSIAVHNSIGYRIIICCCDCTINFNTLYRSHKQNIVYKA